MADDLRHRYDRDLDFACASFVVDDLGIRSRDTIDTLKARILAVRDEAMEDLRAELKTVEGQRDDHRKVLRNVGLERDSLRKENAYCREALKGAENRRQMWRERAEKAEAVVALTRERLDALIAAGFGAVTDTLRELCAALDDTRETEDG